MKKLLMIVMMLVLLMGCQKEELSKLEQIQDNGKLVIGTSADYPPYEFHKEIDGEDTIVGFDIALAEKIADDLGVELEIVDMSFDGLLAALMADKIDMVVAGMNPTEERKKSVDFSSVYYDTSQTMLVKSDLVDTLNSINAFAGLKVGVQKATLQEEIFDTHFVDSEKVAIGKIPNLIMELQSGKIDGIILAEVVANSYAKENDMITVNGMDLGSEGGVAIAMKKEQSDLLDLVNQSIAQVMKDGTMDTYIMDAMSLSEEQ